MTYRNNPISPLRTLKIRPQQRRRALIAHNNNPFTNLNTQRQQILRVQTRHLRLQRTDPPLHELWRAAVDGGDERDGWAEVRGVGEAEDFAEGFVCGGVGGCAGGWGMRLGVEGGEDVVVCGGTVVYEPFETLEGDVHATRKRSFTRLSCVSGYA